MKLKIARLSVTNYGNPSEGIYSREQELINRGMQTEAAFDTKYQTYPKLTCTKLKDFDMTNLNEIFSGNYLKAADLQGKPVTVTISAWDLVEFDDGKKLILAFKGAEKQLVCNKTNATTIAEVTGSEELENWVGKTITLIPMQTDFQGKSVPCVRVKLPDQEHHQGNAPEHQNQDGDSIPF